MLLCFVLVLWHFNLRRLSNAKSNLYIYIWFSSVGFGFMTYQPLYVIQSQIPFIQAQSLLDYAGNRPTVQCRPDEPSWTWTKICVQARMPDYNLNWTARSSALQGLQRCLWYSQPTQRWPNWRRGPFGLICHETSTVRHGC